MFLDSVCDVITPNSQRLAQCVLPFS